MTHHLLESGMGVLHRIAFADRLQQLAVIQIVTKRHALLRRDAQLFLNAAHCAALGDAGLHHIHPVFAGKDDGKLRLELALQLRKLMRLRVVFIVERHLAYISQIAVFRQIVHDLNAGVIHAGVSNEFRRSRLFNQCHLRTADDGIDAPQTLRRRHDSIKLARVDGVNQQPLVPLHDQRAVFADKHHILKIGFKIPTKCRVLSAACHSEADASLFQCGHNLRKIRRQPLLAVQQRSVHIAGDELNHGCPPCVFGLGSLRRIAYSATSTNFPLLYNLWRSTPSLRMPHFSITRPDAGLSSSC